MNEFKYAIMVKQIKYQIWLKQQSMNKYPKPFIETTYTYLDVGKIKWNFTYTPKKRLNKNFDKHDFKFSDKIDRPSSCYKFRPLHNS